MNEIKWYWWVIAAIVILYLIGRQKNLSLQQEVQCAFGFCGTLTSGDSFTPCITTISPGITEGNLGHACAPIGAPTMVHCNHIVVRRCGIPTNLPRGASPTTPSLPTFHAPAAIVSPASPRPTVGYTTCSLRRPYIAAPSTATTPAQLTYYCNFVGTFRTVARP